MDRQYPAYLYNAKGETKLVNNKEEEKALGPGWTSVPGGKADAPAPAPEKPVAPDAPKPAAAAAAAPDKPKH